MKKILWAIDPFQTRKPVLDACVSTLNAITKDQKILIEPIYILSDGILGLSVPASSLAKNFKPIAEKALFKMLKEIDLPNMLPPKVIIKSLSSATDAAKALNQYATLHSFDIIAVSTHARKGVSRLLLGSFSENLSLHITHPLLIINPNTSSSKTIKRILFATDFSKASENAFKKVIKSAKELNSALLLFHGISAPVDPVIQSGLYLLGGGAAPIKKDFYELETARKAKAQVWVKNAKKNGIRCHAIVQSWCTSTSDAVLKIANKEKVDLIAMAAQSGPVSSALLGSATRQVIRNAIKPIWILRA